MLGSLGIIEITGVRAEGVAISDAQKVESLKVANASIPSLVSALSKAA